VRKALYALFATDTEEGTEAYELELEVIVELKAALRQAKTPAETPEKLND
jgi:hypothetical protein